MDRRRTTVAVALVVGVCAVLSAALWLLRDPGGATRAVTTASAASVSSDRLGIEGAAAVERVTGGGVDPPGIALLRAWDARRAAAWARGDPAALSALYTSESRTGRADRAMLAAYADRGLLVRGLREQVLEAHVVARSAGRLRLRVVDRLAAATAVGPGLRRALPGGTATAHVVDLVRVGRRWRVSEVRDG